MRVGWRLMVVIAFWVFVAVTLALALSASSAVPLRTSVGVLGVMKTYENGTIEIGMAAVTPGHDGVVNMARQRLQPWQREYWEFLKSHGGPTIKGVQMTRVSKEIKTWMLIKGGGLERNVTLVYTLYDDSPLTLLRPNTGNITLTWVLTNSSVESIRKIDEYILKYVPYKIEITIYSPITREDTGKGVSLEAAFQIECPPKYQKGAWYTATYRNVFGVTVLTITHEICFGYDGSNVNSAQAYVFISGWPVYSVQSSVQMPNGQTYQGTGDVSTPDVPIDAWTAVITATSDASVGFSVGDQSVGIPHVASLVTTWEPYGTGALWWSSYVYADASGGSTTSGWLDP